MAAIERRGTSPAVSVPVARGWIRYAAACGMLAVLVAIGMALYFSAFSPNSPPPSLEKEVRIPELPEPARQPVGHLLSELGRSLDQPLEKELEFAISDATNALVSLKNSFIPE